MMDDLIVDIYSFGYQFSGIPEDLTENNGGFVFDCRFLPNPGRQVEYAALTGKDSKVIAYLQEYEQVDKFIRATKEIVDMAIENYLERGFSHLMVSYGCTGGQHRSVYCSEQLYKYLKSRNLNVNIHHVEF